MKRYLELLKEWCSRHDLTEEEESTYADKLDRLWWEMDKAEQTEVVEILDKQKEQNR